MVGISDLLLSSAPSEIAEGWIREPATENYRCLLCGQTAEAGRIYRSGEDYFEAERFIREHVVADHGSVLGFLLGLERKLTGITEQQGALMLRLSRGEEDKRIAAELGIASSTVRNRRFGLRERARQARLFLAAVESMEKSASAAERGLS